MGDPNSVRGHVCEQMHSWYTDDEHVMPVCPFCNLPPWKTNDPHDPDAESADLDVLLSNYAAAAITASHGEDFLDSCGWGEGPKVRYWEIAILSRFESLKRQKNG